MEMRMNSQDKRYAQYALVKEMLETAGVIRSLRASEIAAFPVQSREIFLTGEGSSRIFPAKNLMYTGLKNGYPYSFATDGGDQACEYDLSKKSVFVASNSGRTAECVRIVRKLKAGGHQDITGIATHSGTPIMTEPNRAYRLSCGGEDAVAATKSVVEQALFYDLLFRSKAGSALPDLKMLGDAVETVLKQEITTAITERLAASPVLYFAGRNNGVAEELALKTNEITRKPSAFLEGSFAVHGIEEVMTDKDTIIVIDPFEEEEEKFDTVLQKGVGLEIIVVASRETRFTTIRIPELDSRNGGSDCAPYLQLAAGWNLLVETGLALGINLDKPERARKVGNEFEG
jgi:glutamine---fructose-6-phosphate transaminase (isomerizing)